MDRIFLTLGLIFSFLGVVLMVESTLDRKKGLISVGPYHRRTNFYGWVFLISGVALQIIGVWIT